jgi:hypothetical protein
MKGTSPSQACGEVLPARQSGVTIEVPANIDNLSEGEVMNKITTKVITKASK